MKLYNTLTRKIEDVNPLTDNTLAIYTCGLTVYSQPHIGNWVAYIYWDILVRVLKDAGYDVNRVQNITDVGHLTSDEDAGEDKMEKGARAENLTAWDVAKKYADIADTEAYTTLGLLRPDHMPKATDYIPQQIAFVQALEAKGFTYKIPADGIYFDTSKLNDYGALAQLDVEGLRSGARVEDTGKQQVTDFALWKFSPKGHQRDMEWNSPWGKGFPGWHLECSVMAQELLGDRIDIHTGGIDHIPIHHTNEIAQTEALTGEPFSTYWVHNNHLKVDGEKMSKSLGNIYTLNDIQAKGYDIEAFKLTIYSKHYKTEGNFSWTILESSQNRLNTYKAMADHKWQPSKEGVVTKADLEETQVQMRAALQEDLGTPQALVALSELEAAIDSGGINTKSQDAFRDFLKWLDDVLALNLSNRPDLAQKHRKLIAQRYEARRIKDWKASDQLRDQLKLLGLTVKDTARGQHWSLDK